MCLDELDSVASTEDIINDDLDEDDTEELEDYEELEDNTVEGEET